VRYAAYLRRPAWARRRQNHIAWARESCQLCGGPLSSGCEVHHVTYAHRGAERHRELLALHARCHQAVHAAIRDVVTMGAAPDYQHTREDGRGVPAGAKHDQGGVN